MVTEYYPASLIWSQLTALLQDKQTGTFFIATANNTSGRFALDKGRITHCAYQRYHGEEAVQALVQLELGRCSFMPDQAYPFRERDSVEHLHAIQLLNLIPAPPSRVSVPDPIVSPVLDTRVAVVSSASNANIVNNRYYRGYVPVEE